MEFLEKEKGYSDEMVIVNWHFDVIERVESRAKYGDTKAFSIDEYANYLTTTAFMIRKYFSLDIYKIDETLYRLATEGVLLLEERYGYTLEEIRYKLKRYNYIQLIAPITPVEFAKTYNDLSFKLKSYADFGYKETEEMIFKLINTCFAYITTIA